MCKCANKKNPPHIMCRGCVCVMACCVIYGGNENNMHRPPHGECKCAGAAGRPLFGLVSHRHVPPLCSWTSFNHHTSRRSNTRCHETTCLFAHLTHYCASMSVLQTCLVVPCLVLLCMGYVEHPAGRTPAQYTTQVLV